jgi:hypothetical protein
VSTVTVTATFDRDSLLMMLGWIQANRPTAEWEPPFLQPVIAEMQRAVSEPAS